MVGGRQVKLCGILEWEIAGIYYFTVNQPGLGGHVCNAGFMAASWARGKGIGREMCRHSHGEAGRLGFLAMQFNLAVSTHVRTVTLWRELGFEIVGTLPKAFNHAQKGLVDAYVMHKWLDDYKLHATGIQASELFAFPAPHPAPSA